MLLIFCAILLVVSMLVILGLIRIYDDLKHRHEILRAMYADLLDQQSKGRCY